MAASNEKVVVLGGGMAGLTAAAYLARAGLDVELFEQHYRLGGCCTSFKRRQFVFDAAVHQVGGCHPGGILRAVFEDLGLWDRVEMRRADPMDVIISPRYHVPVWVDPERFLAALRENFPREIDRLEKLVRFLFAFGPADFGRWGSATYRELLDHFLEDEAAKTIFILPLGNIGISARRVGAITACTLWRENQLNGGYAPKGSFQALPDALGVRIEELGGKVHKRTEVSRIEVENGQVVGVHVRPMLAALGEERFIPCRHVIGAGAAPHIYLDLIDRVHVPAEYVERLETSEYSFSGIVVFLGLKGNVHERLPHHGCHWVLDEATPDAIDRWLEPEWTAQHMFEEQGPFYAAFPTGYDPELAPPGKSTAVLILPGVHKSRAFWLEHKQRMAEVGVARLEKLLPGIASQVELSYVAHSATIEYFTRNTRGAWYGWSMIPGQSNLKRLPRTGPVGGLHLAGHWTQPGPGVLNAVKSGELTAKSLLRALKKQASAAAALGPHALP